MAINKKCWRFCIFTSVQDGRHGWHFCKLTYWGFWQRDFSSRVEIFFSLFFWVFSYIYTFFDQYMKKRMHIQIGHEFNSVKNGRRVGVTGSGSSYESQLLRLDMAKFHIAKNRYYAELSKNFINKLRHDRRNFAPYEA